MCNKNNIIYNYACTIVTVYQSVVDSYEKNKEIIKNTEEELNDLNHEIEFGKSRDMYQGYLLYKQIKELRLQRRRAKEENELLEELYNFLTGQQAQQFKNKIQQIQGNSVKIREMQERRTYRPRQRDDLTIEGQTSNEQKSFEEMLKDFNKTKVSVQGGKLRK